ncbi:MAG: hypothetical protein ACRCXT_12215 [Paraclostridium sp.]
MAIKINTTIMKDLLTVLTKVNVIIEKSNAGEGREESILGLKKKIVEYAEFSISNKRLDINSFFSAHITHLMLSRYLDLVGSSLVDKQILHKMKRSIDNYCTVVLKTVKPSMELNRIYDTIMTDGSFDVSNINDITDVLNKAQNGMFHKKEETVQVIEEIIKDESSNINETRKEMQDKVSTPTINLDNGKTGKLVSEDDDKYDSNSEEIKGGDGGYIQDETIKSHPNAVVKNPIIDHNINNDEFFKHGIRKIIKAIMEYKPCEPAGVCEDTMIADGMYVSKMVVYSAPKFTKPMLDKIKGLIRDDKLEATLVIDLSTMVSMYVNKIGNADNVFTEEDLALLKDRTFEAMALVY